ncbi:hypothetical protein ACFLXE_08215, partial [Chloroflexota bacterium]
MVKNYNKFDVHVEGGQVHIEGTAGMGRTASHQLLLPLEDPEFQTGLRLLRLEPEGETEEERLDD